MPGFQVRMPAEPWPEPLPLPLTLSLPLPLPLPLSLTLPLPLSRCAAFSPGAELLYAAGAGGKVQVWHVARRSPWP